MNTRRWSAPGSALLAGEYRIIEEGGRGIAVACGGRAVMSTETAETQNFRGVWPGIGQPSTSVEKMSEAIRTVLTRLHEGYSPPTASVLVDTSAFYDESGRKRGYGSSAAAALLFTKAMVPDEELKTLADIAVAAHRVFQDGQGSGYDVLTSAWGGTGVFLGGERPTWRPTGWPKDILGWLIKGPSAVKTPDSVAKYIAWKASRSEEHRSMTREMDRIIDDITSTTDIDSSTWMEGIQLLARIGISLGHAIGVPAMPADLGGLGKDLISGDRRGAAIKCLGAGNELMLLMAFPDSLKNSEWRRLSELVGDGAAEKLMVEEDGLREEHP